MKKKFLSLMMAAAVVATTSVSAFAQDKLIDNVDTSSPTTEVQITGSVTKSDGTMPDSTFKVTVPTTASFSVDQNGGFTAPTLTVKNEGPQKVNVYAYSFKDNSGEGNINILSPADFEQKGSGAKRNEVKISLRGQLGDIVQLSSTKENGVTSEKEPSADRGTDGFKLLELEASTDGTAKSGTISIDGTAGKATSEAVSDTFVLTLKIKKA